MSKESISWHDIRQRLESLAQQYPEWQPSLQLWQATLYALDDPVWEEAVPQACPDRPVAAPLLAGVTCHVDTRRIGRWVRSLAKLARQNTAPGQAALLQVNFHQEHVLALLEAALCQDHARLTALAEYRRDASTRSGSHCASRRDTIAAGLWAAPGIAGSPCMVLWLLSNMRRLADSG